MQFLFRFFYIWIIIEVLLESKQSDESNLGSNCRPTAWYTNNKITVDWTYLILLLLEIYLERERDYILLLFFVEKHKLLILPQFHISSLLILWLEIPVNTLNVYLNLHSSHCSVNIFLAIFSIWNYFVPVIYFWNWKEWNIVRTKHNCSYSI